jgi:uncharacterized damage-inducible protein DinB
MKRFTLTVLGFLLAAVPALAAAQAAPAAAPAVPAGVRGDMLRQLDDAAGKLVQLAEAIPQEKYSWSPGTGVRSVSQVLMHVAGGNYYFPNFAGAKGTPPLPRDAETSVTDRTEVVSHLKKSFDYVRGVIRNMPDAELDKATTMFGQQTTYRNVLFTVVSHCHEHLGQMIAYARSNNVTPPWSMAGS